MSMNSVRAVGAAQRLMLANLYSVHGDEFGRLAANQVLWDVADFVAMQHGTEYAVEQLYVTSDRFILTDTYPDDPLCDNTDDPYENCEQNQSKDGDVSDTEPKASGIYYGGKLTIIAICSAIMIISFLIGYGFRGN